MKNKELTVIQHALEERRKNPPASLEEARIGYDKLCSSFAPPQELQFDPVDLLGVPALWGHTKNLAEPQKTILYIHGGGFMVGSAAGFKGIAGTLAHTSGAQVFIADYRLAPEHQYPAACDDVLQAYCALLKRNIPASSIALAGDSAGAELIIQALIKAKAKGLELPACILLLSPWIDLQLQGKTISSKAAEDIFLTANRLSDSAASYLGEHIHKSNTVLAADLQGLPPMMIQVGSKEILLDDAVRLTSLAGAANVQTYLEIWPDMFHVWPAFAPRLTEGRQALIKGGTFIQQHLSTLAC